MQKYLDQLYLGLIEGFSSAECAVKGQSGAGGAMTDLTLHGRDVLGL